MLFSNMAQPSDETSFYELVVRGVARCEIKLNKLLERKTEDAKTKYYLRRVVRTQRETIMEQKIYIKKLERELKLK